MKKSEHISMARGIGIILVVIGHAMTGQMRAQSAIVDFLFYWIYSFHMPLFMFSSGYLFEINYKRYEKEGNKHFFANRIKKFVVPYLTYSVLVYVGLFILKYIGFMTSVLDSYSINGIFESTKQILFCHNNLDQHIWFIYVLFWIQVLFFVIKGIPQKKILYMILLFAFLFLGFFHKYFEISTILGRIFNYSLFFCVGGLFKRYEERLVYSKVWIVILFFVSSIVFALVTMQNNEYGIVGSFIYFVSERCVGILGSISIIIASIYMNKYISKCVAWCDMNSYGIYLFHQPFLTSGLSIICLKFLKSPFWVCLITIPSSIFISVFIAKLLRKWKISRFIFGL